MRLRSSGKNASWVDVGIILMLRKNAIVIMLAVLVLTVVGINALAPCSLPDDPLEAALRLKKTGLYDATVEYLEDPIIGLQGNDSASLDLVYHHISSYFEAHPDDSGSDIVWVYKSLAAESGVVTDVGRYGQGLISSFTGQYDDALILFEQVSDRSLKYLNNSTGYVHLALGNDEQAEAYFWREIELGGYVPGAVQNLATLYLKAGRFEDVRRLIADDQTGPYVLDPARSELARRTGKIWRYLSIMLLSHWRYAQIDAVMVSLVICVMWFIYLWRIDVFEQEPLRFTLGMLVLGGGLSSELCWILQDLAPLVSPFSVGNGKWGELLYYVLHAGLTEEIAKFAPVLVFVLLFRQVDEPLDMVIYGSLTALGFATLENSRYLTSQGLRVGFDRLAITTVVHMSLTGIICCAWAWARYIRKRSPVLTVLLGLAIAIVLHGLYNFSVANLDWYPYLRFVYIGFVLFFSISYGGMLRWALSHSPFRDVHSSQSDRLKNHSLLFSTALLMLLIGFLQNSFACATKAANALLYAAFTHSLPGVIGLGVLGRLKVKEPVKLSSLLRRCRRW